MKIKFLAIITLFCLNAFSQNVGIGITNPTKSKFEVFGATAGGFTSGLFGSDGAGISLQRNWPTIGFNQYNNGVSRYMSTGFAAIQNLNMGTGTITFTMSPSGTANTPTPSGIIGLSLFNNGHVGILGGDLSASLSVSRGMGLNGTAVFAGTTHFSHFNYGTTEDTYIRAGKNNSTVFINDIIGGNVQIGIGSSKVGINIESNFSPGASLDINGAIAYRPLVSAIVPVTGGTLITVGDRSYLFITNANQAAGTAEFRISNGITAGQILIIEIDEANGTNSVLVRRGANIGLGGNPTFLSGGTTLSLIWNGTKWHQTSLTYN